MGNHHGSNGSSLPESASSSTTNLSAVIRKSAMAKLLRDQKYRRRCSMEIFSKKESHANHRSFTFGQSPTGSVDSADGPGRGSSTEDGLKPPRIEINGAMAGTNDAGTGTGDKQEQQKPAGTNLEAKMEPKNEQRRGSSGSSIGFAKHRAHKVDSRKIAAKKRLERGQTVISPSEKNGTQPAAGADHRRAGFFHASNGWARSLDTHNNGGLYASPISRHQQRNGLQHHRGSGGPGVLLGEDGGLLGIEQSDAVQRSWRRARERIEQFAGHDRCFAYYAFDRIFERAPELKPLFGLSPSQSLADLDDDPLHPFTRHVRVFDNILDLSARNAGELETEMLPALFTYGQRHYKPKLMDEFGERTVRLFCSQVVGAMCDLLGDEFSQQELEAWVEMVTYMGRALLSGFEYERQNTVGHRKRSTKF